MTRRRVLGAIGGAGALLAGGRLALLRLLRHPPPRALDGEALAFAERCFQGLDRSKVWDAHTHLVGLPEDGRGCDVNPQFRSALHPWKKLQFDLYLAASGVSDGAAGDDRYLDRLLALHRLANPAGRIVLLAFDRHVRDDGSEDLAESEFYTPDERVLAVAAAHPDAVVPCASVHPYRRDAIERLDRAAAAGARAVKWLPNAMGIDPASPRCDAFYRRLAALRLPLITHTGDEQAVDARDRQRLGNPLRLRRPLDAGVTVVAAHCASSGEGEDLDKPPGARPVRPCFDLLLRLFAETQYGQTLYGDISALTQRNRCGRPLRELLAATDLHGRLVNGSDYPLPAIDILVSTRTLVGHHYLTPDERRLCNLVFDANPLLYDFVVKRSVKVETVGRTHRFPPSVFETARLFAPA